MHNEKRNKPLWAETGLTGRISSFINCIHVRNYNPLLWNDAFLNARWCYKLIMPPIADAAWSIVEYLILICYLVYIYSDHCTVYCVFFVYMQSDQEYTDPWNTKHWSNIGWLLVPRLGRPKIKTTFSENIRNDGYVQYTLLFRCTRISTIVQCPVLYMCGEHFTAYCAVCGWRPLYSVLRCIWIATIVQCCIWVLAIVQCSVLYQCTWISTIVQCTVLYMSSDHCRVYIVILVYIDSDHCTVYCFFLCIYA